MEDFTEVARLEIYSAVETVEAWAREVTDQNDGEMEREINIVRVPSFNGQTGMADRACRACISWRRCWSLIPTRH